MTAHWIEVKENKWLLRSEVVEFKAVSGDHSGWNLGRYFVGLCDGVGICQPTASKVCGIWTLFDMTLQHVRKTLSDMLFFFLAIAHRDLGTH